ncbi:unnamed protein product [Effrenium voratum]|nr:unnamed protein product [Effrenium voratum]CAJ1447237.1 unnamed protein product [Effrenium voratum]
MADMEVGFQRSEMNSEPLAGTMKPLEKHLFLTWGLATAWPEDPFDKTHAGTLPVDLDQALGKAKKEIKSKLRLTLVEREAGMEDGHVMLYPDGVQFDLGADGAKTQELVKYLKGEVSKGLRARDIEDATVFVCAHLQRDARCGHCGPELSKAAQSLVATGQVPKLNIRRCSHVGGHKYAGNVIVYGGDYGGHWHRSAESACSF